MESLFRGILMSHHPENLKNQLLLKGFETLQNQSLAQNDCNLLFKLFIEWILSSDKEGILVKYGHVQLEQVGKNHPGYFRDFITPNVIIEFFQSGHENKTEIALLIR